MKKNTKLSGLYLGIVFFLMYLPVAVVIIFSFNESRLPVRFTGFSLKWYQELLNDLPGILSACPDQYGDHLSGGISFRVFYGKNV